MAEPLQTFPEWESIPPEIRENMQISRERFEAMRALIREREARTPPVGSSAPDFDLKRLSAEGVLTEERLRLANLRGRPVALVFGSYT